MSTYADLEISLRRRDEQKYDIDLSFTPPNSDGDMRLIKNTPQMQLDVESMRKYQVNPDNYGQKLADAFFGDPRVAEAFNIARHEAQTHKVPLRVRFFIDHNAIELHSLRWETLQVRDLDQQARSLLTDENILFSRYLSSSDYQPLTLRSKSDLKALVVIANPTDLDPTQLKPIDVTGELDRAKAGLGNIVTTALASNGQANLNRIKQELRSGYDLLYLVCHGVLEENSSWLWLEKDDGKAHVVSGQELVNHLKELPERPRLVVLASCQSAGTGKQAHADDDGALAALGPQLAEAGIAAVLAMQGNIFMQTVEQFMPEFFRELQRDGQIDRAMAAARGFVRDRPDWWMPVLFMRSRSGRLWEADDTWEPLKLEPTVVKVPAGAFMMGSQPGPSIPKYETPATEIFLDEYWIGKYPVTNQEYELFLRETDWTTSPELGWGGSDCPPTGQERAPVQGVTWFEAAAYSEWLSQRTGRPYSLPGEAHWEKAAKGNYLQKVGYVREWTRTIWGVTRPCPDERFNYPWKNDARENPYAGNFLYRVYRGLKTTNDQVVRTSARAGFLPYYPGPPGQRHGFRVMLNFKDKGRSEQE